MKEMIKKILAVVCTAAVMSVYTGAVVSASGTEGLRPMPGTDAAQTQNADSEDNAEQNNSDSYGVSASNETRVRTSSSNTSSASNYIASSENGSGEDAENTDEGGEDEQNNSVVPPTIVPVAADNSNETAPQAPQEEAPAQKKGVGMGTVFLWFLLSVIVNAIVSFWVANRFYKMARKDTHVTAEIRALRRDVEEKFVSNVGGFTEMDNEISNSNDDYSGGEGITIPDRREERTERTERAERTAEKPTVNDGFEEDAFRQWELRQTEWENRRAEAGRTAKTTKTAKTRESNVEKTQRISTSRNRIRREEPEREIRKKKYQPERTAPAETDFDDEYDVKREPKKTSQNLNAVKNKAKEFLGDIFPFKDEDE